MVCNKNKIGYALICLWQDTKHARCKCHAKIISFHVLPDILKSQHHRKGLWNHRYLVLQVLYYKGFHVNISSLSSVSTNLMLSFHLVFHILHYNHHLLFDLNRVAHTRDNLFNIKSYAIFLSQCLCHFLNLQLFPVKKNWNVPLSKLLE